MKFDFFAKPKTELGKSSKATSSKKVAVMAAATSAIVSASSFVTPVLCATTVDIDTIMGSILGILFTMAFWVGIMLLIWGVFQFVMSMKNDDADAKSRAIMVIVSGVFLAALESLLTSFLSVMGVTITSI